MHCILMSATSKEVKRMQILCHYNETRNLKDKDLGNGLLKESYYTSILGKKLVAENPHCPTVLG